MSKKKNLPDTKPAKEGLAEGAQTILIVDDDLDLLDYVAECLEPVGARVLRAADGKEALEICMSEKVDLIISDITMPNVDGLEFVGMLRDRNDDRGKIVAVTRIMKRSAKPGNWAHSVTWKSW